MKTYQITVKAKIGGLQLPNKEFSYEEPEDFEEGIEMDGEQKALKLYLNERKTQTMDKYRKKMVADFTKALGNLSADKLREFGLDI